MDIIKYRHPMGWIQYSAQDIIGPLAETKAAINTLKILPRTRDYTEEWRATQLKREAAGTSRIEGAEFTEEEFENALLPEIDADNPLTHSQRQARAAEQAYKWLTTLPSDYPFSVNLIKNIHRIIIHNCDDNHCKPGALRQKDENVNFGQPRHRGAVGGEECEKEFFSLIQAVSSQFRAHDPLIQALVLHYHFVAIHPFRDGNGRTARAAEAFMLRKAGLQEEIFIPVSNFYYENKDEYLNTLNKVRQKNGELTSFLVFGLKGIRMLCEQAIGETTRHLRKSFFRDCMRGLFNRLEGKRTRVIAKRQMTLLYFLLEQEVPIHIEELITKILKDKYYRALKKPAAAFRRDISKLLDLKAVKFDPKNKTISVNLLWPELISIDIFKEKFNVLPQARSYGFLQDRD